MPVRDGIYTSPGSSDITDSSSGIGSTLEDVIRYLAEQTARAADATEAIAIELARQNNWVGEYRKMDVKVPAMEVNYEISWPFPARVFILESVYSLGIKLGSTSGDSIPVDSEKSSIQMFDIHHMMAFDKVFATNLSAVDAIASLTIFG